MTTSFDRRQFLAGALGVAATGALHTSPARMLGQRSVTAQKRSSPAAGASSAGGTLVLCTLYGGNDGLNSVVPMNDSAYASLRGGIALAPNSLLSLGDGFGLNPVLPGFKALWDAGHLAIIRGVGYPDPNLSHFQSMDIWQSASTRNDVTSGWIGRWLDRTKPDVFQAISIGPSVLPAMVGDRRKATALQDSSWSGSQLPDGKHSLLNTYRKLQRPAPGHTRLESGVAQSGTNLLNVSEVVVKALNKVPPPSYPSGLDVGDLGTQLGIVSQLIRAGLPTKAYAVTQGGYDTHAGELNTQSANLKQLDAVVSAFSSSIAGSPRAAGTVLLIYTEFGRRVQANGSGGTDHGAANVCFAIGPSVRGGFYGDPPSLTRLDDDGNLVHSIDFRSVYATLLEKTIGIEPRAVLAGNFAPVGFL